MATVPLEWKLSIQGAEEVKTKLNDINNQFDRGEISAKEYAKGLREINRDARSFNASANMQKNIFLATHPAFNQLTRAMSVMNSVARTGLVISNAMNLMWMRQNGESASLATARHELAAAQRDYNKAVRDFGPDSEQAADAMERINIAGAQIKELGNPFKTMTDNIVIFASSITAISTLLSAFPKLATALTLPAWITGSGGLAGLVAIPAALAVAGYAISDWIISSNEWMSEMRDTNRILFDKLFTQDIPLALGQAGAFLANFFLTQFPEWVKNSFEVLKGLFTSGWNAMISITQGAINGIIGGVEYMVNRFIAGINKMISAYNRIARKIGLGQISTIASVSFGRVTIPTIAAANGFDGMVNQPTLFLTGEAGPEHVSVTPSGGSKGGGSGISVIVNVHGSILTEKELFRRVDENLKNELRKRNYRLLQ